MSNIRIERKFRSKIMGEAEEKSARERLQSVNRNKFRAHRSHILRQPIHTILLPAASLLRRVVCDGGLRISSVQTESLQLQFLFLRASKEGSEGTPVSSRMLERKGTFPSTVSNVHTANPEEK